jgi:site-specific recombinase XerD
MYLKSEERQSHNSAMKHIKRLKKVVNLAIANEWLKINPFSSYHIKTQATHRGFLTPEELQIIETKELSVLRLQKVRDIFIFCCYTGLSFSDVEKLTPSDITTGIDGEKWLVIYRKKNGHRSPVPLLPQARAILDKYRDDPEANAKGTLLPVNSNQRMNGYLKEIADVCGIQKNLTMHLARHTFATTVTLANGVPIETVSKMLGHSSIKTTQIYSKVVDTKISNDMAQLKQKLSPPNKLTINQAM